MHTGKPEHIVVIGGGLSGCLTALLLSRIKIDEKDPSSPPKYHITLLEKEPLLLNGASLIASRLHLGGEYPLDKQTGFDCLKGAIIWKLLMPNDIYTDREPMKFTVARETEIAGKAAEEKAKSLEKDALWLRRHGRNKDAQEKQNQAAECTKNTLTVDKYIAYYETICQEYKKYFDKVDREKRKKNKEWTKSDTANFLFGLPQRGKHPSRHFEPGKPPPDFYYPLTQNDIERYNHATPKGVEDVFKDRLALQIGFQSQEPGLHIARYLSQIEQALKTAGVDVRCNCEVKDFKHDGITLLEEGEDKGKYKILSNQDDIIADQVVQAAWTGGPAMNKLNKSGKIYRRAMQLIDITKLDVEQIQPIFVMLGEHGGMLAPYNDRVAIGYIPGEDAAYKMGEQTLDAEHLSLPGRWVKALGAGAALGRRALKAWANAYFSHLKELFPVLQDAKGGELIIRDTMNFQEEVSKRRHEPTVEIKPGLITVYPTKATLAPQSALEAVMMVEARSKAKEMHQSLPIQKNLQDVFETALTGKYSIADVVDKIGRPGPAIAMEFASLRGIPPDMVVASRSETYDIHFHPRINRGIDKGGEINFLQ